MIHLLEGINVKNQFIIGAPVVNMVIALVLIFMEGFLGISNIMAFVPATFYVAVSSMVLGLVSILLLLNLPVHNSLGCLVKADALQEPCFQLTGYAVKIPFLVNLSNVIKDMLSQIRTIRRIGILSEFFSQESKVNDDNGLS